MKKLILYIYLLCVNSLLSNTDTQIEVLIIKKIIEDAKWISLGEDFFKGLPLSVMDNEVTKNIKIEKELLDQLKEDEKLTISGDKKLFGISKELSDLVFTDNNEALPPMNPRHFTRKMIISTSPKSQYALCCHFTVVDLIDSKIVLNQKGGRTTYAMFQYFSLLKKRDFFESPNDYYSTDIRFKIGLNDKSEEILEDQFMLAYKNCSHAEKR